MKRILGLLFVCCLSFTMLGYADQLQDATENYLDGMVAKASDRKEKKKKKNISDKPYWTSANNVQKKSSLFTQMNMGIGFLYFDNLKTNVGGIPATNFTANLWDTFKYKGRQQYNRSPLMEYVLGYRVNRWFKFGVSYQNQAGVAIQTQAAIRFGDDGARTHAIFTSLLNLNAILAKAYVELHPMVWNNIAYFPYLGAAFGPGWQSWTENSVTYYNNTGTGIPIWKPLALNQKVSANLVWMLDAGFRIRNAMPNVNFSLVTGCKFTSWGQCREIGQLKDQNNLKKGLLEPYKIKMLYSFAPYLGFQWNFPASNYKDSNQYITSSSNRPHAFVSFSDQVNKVNRMFTQFNVGAGFLFFDNIKGRLGGIPATNFTETGAAPYRGRLNYAVTPLYEYLIGFQHLSWFKYALSYQNQQNITVATKNLDSFGATPNVNVTQKLSTQLSLNAIMAKAYFQLPYYTSFFRFVSFAPYLALGVGPAWQSWTNVMLYSESDFLGTFTDAALPLRQNISANCAFQVDAGLFFKSLNNALPFNVSFGCRYNQWGQARNIGALDKQGYGFNKGLSQPFSIKTIYSFAPYMAFQWDFPVDYNYMINKRPIMSWKPFFTSMKNMQSDESVYVSSNVGIGFLRFDKVVGNLGVRPITDTSAVIGTVPYKNRLKYNRTPIMEYILGYRYTNYLKGALSFQHQGAVFIETADLRAGPAGATAFFNQGASFKSQLGLNSLMFKVYAELPFALVWRGWSHSPYIAAGVGPGWQSWTDTQVCYHSDATSGAGAYGSNVLRLRQKISANAVWTVDVGFRMKNATPNTKFSLMGGCKFNSWGQARYIGKIDQQGDLNIGLFKPLRIHMIYQFAPYLGVQWNF